MSPAPEQPDAATHHRPGWAASLGLGDQEAALLLPAVYDRLRAISAAQRRRLPIHTLQTTALVNEAWLKLTAGPMQQLEREHFFGLFARVARNVLIDHVRASAAGKRAAPLTGLTGVEDLTLDQAKAEQMLAIDQALSRLESEHPRLVRVVEMRFFAGFENAEIAELLGVNEKTVRRDWLLARARLAQWLDADD